MLRAPVIALATLQVLLSGSAATPDAAPTLHLEPYTAELGDGSQLAAERGTLVVPADRGRHDGHTVELYFVRIRGVAGAGATPSLYLAGGPGENATGLLRTPWAGQVVAAYRRVGDLILLDQRGTGRSTPVPSCALQQPLPPFAFVDGAAMLAATRQAVARCAAEWAARGVDLYAFNSRDAADDIDDLRAALGADKVNLVGFSSGTHLALATLRRHGDHLSRVALIGTEGPASTYKLPSTFDRQLQKLSLLAAADPAVNRDVPDMMALLRRVLDQLARQPVKVTVHDRTGDKDVTVEVGRYGLLRILRWDVGDGHDFIAFPALLHGIANGDPSLLARYVEKRWNQLGRGIALMPIATDCASGVSALRLARIRAEEPASTFGEVTNDPFPAICEAVGNPDLGDDFRSPIVSSVPTLLVSGTLDSNTPPYQAEEVRWGLTAATHLTVDNAGHEDTLPMPEVQRAIFDFLAGQDVSGRHLALPVPRFLSLAAARSFHP